MWGGQLLNGRMLAIKRGVGAPRRTHVPRNSCPRSPSPSTCSPWFGPHRRPATKPSRRGNVRANVTLDERSPACYGEMAWASTTWSAARRASALPGQLSQDSSPCATRPAATTTVGGMATKPIRMFASLALAALLVFGCGGSSERLSEEVRTYPIEMLDGQPTTLATFADRPTVINFFGSWCKPCVLEMPDIEALHVELGDRAKFIGIDTQETPTPAARSSPAPGATYPIPASTLTDPC